jgi:F-type H+-transporting ATPase subunit delta
MMGQATLARPYARAAFATARDAGAVDAWASHLALASAIARDPQAARVMGDPRVSPAQLAQLFLPQGMGGDDSFARLLATLVENRRLALLPEIADGFAELKREHDRVLQVTVKSAVALDADTEQAMRSALKRRFGREIELRTSVDESLIGGAVIDAGDVTIDGSVRGRLARMQTALRT